MDSKFRFGSIYGKRKGHSISIVDHVNVWWWLVSYYSVILTRTLFNLILRINIHWLYTFAYADTLIKKTIKTRKRQLNQTQDRITTVHSILSSFLWNNKAPSFISFPHKEKEKKERKNENTTKLFRYRFRGILLNHWAVKFETQQLCLVLLVVGLPRNGNHGGRITLMWVQSLFLLLCCFCFVLFCWFLLLLWFRVLLRNQRQHLMVLWIWWFGIVLFLEKLGFVFFFQFFSLILYDNFSFFFVKLIFCFVFVCENLWNWFAYLCLGVGLREYLWSTDTKDDTDTDNNLRKWKWLNVTMCVVLDTWYTFDLKCLCYLGIRIPLFVSCVFAQVHVLVQKYYLQ